MSDSSDYIMYILSTLYIYTYTYICVYIYMGYPEMEIPQVIQVTRKLSIETYGFGDTTISPLYRIIGDLGLKNPGLDVPVCTKKTMG